MRRSNSCRVIGELLADAEKEIVRVDRIIAEKQSRLEVLRQMNEEGEGLARARRLF